MRAKVIHVTDHAFLRWTQRVSDIGNVFDIKQAVQKSKIIKKCENLPYPMPRLDGSVYSLYNNVMFILESISIDEYRLVTVVAEFTVIRLPRRASKEKQKEKNEAKVVKRKNKLQETLENKKIRENEKSHKNRPKNRSVKPILAAQEDTN